MSEIWLRTHARMYGHEFNHQCIKYWDCFTLVYSRKRKTIPPNYVAQKKNSTVLSREQQPGSDVNPLGTAVILQSLPGIDPIPTTNSQSAFLR